MTDLTLEQPPQPEPPSAAAVPATGGRVTVKANRLGYSGQIGGVYRIWLLNIFLSVITLGIYSFWGKTRMRRYLTGCFRLGGDTFEYTGTGKELFTGFAKASPVLIVFFICASLLPPFFAWVVYLPLLYLIPVAIFMSMRYRLNRVTWRGIRARLTGSPFRFGGFALWRMFLNVVSFGILIPASDIATYGYMANRAGIGNMRARFEGKSSALVATHVVTLIISGAIVVAAIGFVFFAGGAAAMSGAGQEGASAAASAAAFVGFLLAGVLVMLTRSFYHAALMREKMRGLTLGSIRFKCTATGLDVLKLRLGNLLLVVFTLGLAMPVVIHRRMKFSAQHLIVGGDLDSADLMQAARENGAVGEGLDDLFGIDTDIGLG